MQDKNKPDAAENKMNKDHAWIEKYPEHLNWEDRIDIKPIYGLMENARSKYGDRPAFDFLGKTYKWSDET